MVEEQRDDTTGSPSKTRFASRRDASLRPRPGSQSFPSRHRGCRCAQPPANRWDPSGIIHAVEAPPDGSGAHQPVSLAPDPSGWVHRHRAGAPQRGAIDAAGVRTPPRARNERAVRIAARLVPQGGTRCAACVSSYRAGHRAQPTEVDGDRSLRGCYRLDARMGQK